jgi:phosphohistidine phosphatase
VPFVFDLLRHGDALPAADGVDRERRLSTRGERDLERLAAHLARLAWHPERAFTSPLRRAIESARLVLRHAAPELEPTLTEALRPDAEADRVLDALEIDGLGEGHVLLVGHQPLLGELARLWAGADRLRLAPGDLLRVEFPGERRAGAGRVLWHVRRQDCA